jgi:hypothetical protein
MCVPGRCMWLLGLFLNSSLIGTTAVTSDLARCRPGYTGADVLLRTVSTLKDGAILFGACRLICDHLLESGAVREIPITPGSAEVRRRSGCPYTEQIGLLAETAHRKNPVAARTALSLRLGVTRLCNRLLRCATKVDSGVVTYRPAACPVCGQASGYLPYYNQ